MSQKTPTPVCNPIQVQTIATPVNEPRPAVFISYVHEEKALADRLIADLSAAGHACWIDTSSIKGGEDWVKTISEGIINSYAVVVIVTLRAMRSTWVRKETLWAQKNKRLVIPVIMEDVMDEAGFLPLMDCQGVKFFETEYDSALRKLLESLPTPALPNASSVGAGEAPAENAPVESAVTVVRTGSLHKTRRKRELAYLERLKLEELVNADKYTPMAGVAEQKAQRQSLPRAEMRPVFELLPMIRSKDHKPRPERRRFENAVHEIRGIRRVVLLGEPGGGKTTTIWKLAAELVVDAERDGEASIPLLIRLGRWAKAGESLPAFIASLLGDLGVDLDQLLTEKRCALLLDGLNELPTGQRETKYEEIKRLIDDHPELLAVVSCRELDYTVDLGFDMIKITPLDPIRIREFIVRYLGAERGESLFWKLAGQEARDNYDRFIRDVAGQLTEPEQIFWIKSKLPESYHWGWYDDDNKHWQNWIRLRETPSSLMVLARNPYMLLMLTSVYEKKREFPKNRGELFRLFVETLLERERVTGPDQTLLTDGLAQVAYQMQMRLASGNEQGTVEALTVLSREEVRVILSERLLHLVGSLGILSVGAQARFTHQLLQEYFVARYMEIEINAGRLKASDIWKPNQWWERTNWEEAAILYAGLYSDDCSSAVEWVAEANVEVAAQCVMRSGAELNEATRKKLRRTWNLRLTDLENDLKPEARAAIGRALGLTAWDDRPGVGVKVTMIDEGKVKLPDIDWVEIPAGEFLYGYNYKRDKSAPKPQKLTLPAFRISRYPVTYAQFQTFLDDPEGYPDPRWFKGMAASNDEVRIGEQYFKFANHPRENVNWYQAMAFCRWLSWRLGGEYSIDFVERWAVRLPTEYEWEKAARGTDGYLYTYGMDFDETKYNATLMQTSAVGIFPDGASPYGVMDLSGNVSEWCLTDYHSPQLDVRRQNLKTDNGRILRGSSWFGEGGGGSAISRYHTHPSFSSRDIGFSVAVQSSLPAQGFLRSLVDALRRARTPNN